jgi:Protein of unknown function (DUF938)
MIHVAGQPSREGWPVYLCFPFNIHPSQVLTDRRIRIGGKTVFLPTGRVSQRATVDAMKQYSQACDENKEPILAILRDAFADARNILEIGSGTGQHAVYFARQLPNLTWQPSDLRENHASILAWREAAGLANVLPPIELDVTSSAWPDAEYDGLFSANSTHIMSWEAVQSMFGGIGKLLPAGARCCLYGPFNYAGTYTSNSNRQFDAWLKQRDPASGIRDFEAIAALADANDLELESDHEMPVNNRLLVWKKN